MEFPRSLRGVLKGFANPSPTNHAEARPGHSLEGNVELHPFGYPSLSSEIRKTPVKQAESF